ncbi:MAG: tRNA epoxyqueuosine(34) reductase QueG [Planctomycetota bacterium]|nr:tRNA epoxyqueuosine(34) reductase QueG [Planctomycetota bacterium]
MGSLNPDKLRELAHEAGFDLVRFGPSEPGEFGPRFRDWIEQGRHGEMHYLERNQDRILDPDSWRPGLRSSINLAVDYSAPPGELTGGGRVARYATNRDYHRWLKKQVLSLRGRLVDEGWSPDSMHGGTDALPVLERALSVRAGVGFLAKSTMVISPTHGPYLQLAELLVGEELPHDGPAAGSCGTCTACIDACPTGAIVAPFELDARRCLSYTTIEKRGFVPHALREAQGEWLFGCDVCLEVCPFTSRSKRSSLAGDDRPKELRPHRVVQTWTLIDVLEMDEERYQTEFVGTAMRRATRSGLRRNAAVVLGNQGDEGALPSLRVALRDEDPVVRGHAAWAIAKIAPGDDCLELALRREDDEQVRSELRRALDR